ncbi:MAG: phospholipase A [Burkholderiales bacterium]|nr:phospholipase A [Burkholderiales bacterium]
MKPQRILGLLVGLAGGGVWAQAPAVNADATATSGWQLCAQQTQDASARLACYDRWVQEGVTASPTPAQVAGTPSAPLEPGPDCHSPRYSALSRYWELEDGTDCGRFNIRGYRPISLSYIRSDTVNRAPSSPTAGHSATSETPYLTDEGRLQLSVRTKIGQGLLPVSDFGGRDSLWFAYTQQSYWQLFTSSISRPFRSTDHEPEVMYIVPTPVDLPGGWRLRYSGLSFNHQSNGQSLPLSRSWNRAILMAGMEKGERYTLTTRLWNRIPDGDETDDNPDIDHLIGRGEVTGSWQVNKDNTLILTLRHSMTSPANGSYRLEWLQALGAANRNGAASGLRLHLQLFSGYGDSLVDYNRGRTVLSIGLSLVDW